MEISIMNIRPASSNEWDEIWKECEYSTYFHSREWSEIWNSYTQGNIKPEPRSVLFSDGKKALFPFSSQKGYKGLVTSYISSPAGTFGGWISTDELNIQHAILLTDFLTNKLGNLVWRLNPYDNLVFQTGVKTSKDDETQALNLSNGFDAIYKGWTKGHKYAARKAAKEGVLVRISSSIDDWYAYYHVYEDSLRRWGDKATSSYRWELFNKMNQCNSSNIKLWLATYQDNVVAGALCFYAKNHVVYWHGAALENYFHLYPVNLLLYEAIKDAHGNGYNWFDFNPSGGHGGVKSFKEGFGVKMLQCPVVNIENNRLKIARIIEKILKRAL